MIVVSGLRRSGTSMTMLALKEAGLDIIGEKFSGDNIEGNPNGYWEIPRICKDEGLREEIDGDAIKIMFEALSFSKPELIDKAILIFREPRKMLYSQFKDNQIDYPNIFICKQAVDMVDSIAWLKYYKIPFKIVLYEDILQSPGKEFKRLFKFIDKGDYKKAKSVVDKKLNRSKDYEGESIYIDTLENIYNKLNEIDTVMSWSPQIMKEAKDLMDNFDKTR